jgi:hypothetical protein
MEARVGRLVEGVEAPGVECIGGRWTDHCAGVDRQGVGRWMMTGNAFVPRLFILQLLFLAATAYAFLNGWYVLMIGEILLIFAFTLPVRSAYSSDPKITINGEIEEILQAYTNNRSSVLWSIKMGSGCWDDYYRLEDEQKQFEKSIEIDPYDDRCIYRWKEGE